MVACRSRRCRGVTGPRAGGVHYRRLVFEVLEQRGMLSGVTPLDPLGGDLGLVDPPGASSEPVPALLGSARYSDSLIDPPPIINRQVTSDPGVQQMPSIAVDPLDSQHLVLAYMDYSLPTADSGLAGEGYAGIGVAVSHDAGDTWQRTAIALPGSFDQGAANPIVRFDDQGQVFVSFMAATFLGEKPPLTNPNFWNPERNASDRALGFQANNGVFVARSDDGGLTWPGPATVVSHVYDGQHPVFFEVIPDLAIDTFVKLPDGRPNPDYGNMYAVWTRLYPPGEEPGYPNSPGGGDIMISVSRDRGQTWQTQVTQREVWQDLNGDGIRQDNEVTHFLGTPIVLASENGSAAAGTAYVDQSHLAIGPEGDIYVSEYGGSYFAVHHSVDAGATFENPDYVAEDRIAFGWQQATVPVEGLPSDHFRTHAVRAIAADPARPGQVYAVEAIRLTDTSGNTVDTADIHFARSTDYGKTWQRTFQVGPERTSILNDDNGGYTASSSNPDEVISGQALPRLAVDAQGDMAVIWYDTRRDPANHSLDVFGTVSTDGGQSFSPNFRASDATFDPDRGAFTDAVGKTDYYLGDFLGLAMANNNAYAAWTDTRQGNQDICVSRFPIQPAPPPLDDRFEPNQTPSTATDVGRVVQQLLPRLAAPPEDEDWFRVEAAASGDMIAKAVFAAATAASQGPQIEIWDGTGSKVLAEGTDVLDEKGNVTAREARYPGEAGEEFLVRVVGANQAPAGAESSSYSLRLQSLTADLGARALARVSGSIQPGGAALYRVTAAAAGSLDVELTPGDTVQGTLNLQILDADTLAPVAPGRSGPVLVASSKEPDDSIGEANQSGLSGLGSVTIDGYMGDGAFGSTSGDYDFYRFEAAPGQKIAATLNPKVVRRKEESLDAMLLLYDNDGKLLHVQDSGSNGDPESFTYLPQTPGSYFLAVAGFGSDVPADPFRPGMGHGAGSTGQYQMTITTEPVGRVPVQQGQTVLLQVTGDGQSGGDYTLEVRNLDRFTTPQNATLLLPDAMVPSTVVVDDFNRDGKPDVAAANTSSNTVSVFLGNGDGTFQSPRLCAVGAFQNLLAVTGVPGFRRDVHAGDFNGDGIPDLVVTNSGSSDVSLLLGRGDGTFEPQRRFDATRWPIGLDLGDVDGDRTLDLAVIDQPVANIPNMMGILPGRGDGTFRPQRTFMLPPTYLASASTVRIADFNKDGRPDLVVSGALTQSGVEIYLGNGDGTFAFAGNFASNNQEPDIAVADVNDDGNLDLITPAFITGTNDVCVLLGNGDGTFQAPRKFFAGQSPSSVKVADVGSQVTLPDGSTVLGPPDGRPDLIVANSGARWGIQAVGGPGVVVLPGLVDEGGHFLGFGSPHTIADALEPMNLAIGDFNGDGATDVAAVDPDGILIVFVKPAVIPPNDTPQSARDLGTVVHLAEPTLTIVPGHDDTYYRLTVPTDAVRGAGDEVIDLSGLFQYAEGAGLNMEVRDPAGNLLGSGERFRVQAKQGEQLLLHVFGAPTLPSPGGGGEARGAGAYTLDIDVLPQVVSVDAEALLPGVGGQPGGPTTSLVMTFQGDRLDPATAEDPANYQVVFLGPDGVAATADDLVVPVHSVVYDPGANIEVSSGRTYPTAVRQTVTLVFDQPLPAGSYSVELSPRIQTAPFSEAESDLLADPTHFAGHPVVSDVAGRIAEGVRVQAVDLVMESGSLGDLDVFYHGTPFLTQLQNDLGARLDSLLTAMGDAPGVSDAILSDILDRVAPGLGEPGERPTSILVIFLDPMTFGVADANNRRVVYDLQANTPVNQIPATFVEVGGNVEVVTVANAAGSYRVNLADVPQNARGGAVLLGAAGDKVISLTSAIREGQRSFVLSMDTAQPSSSSLSGPAAAAATMLASPVQAVTNLVVAPPQPALPSASGNSGAAQQSGGTASVPSSSGSYLGGSPGGGVGLVAEGTVGGDGAPGGAAGKDRGNPPNKPKDAVNAPERPQPVPPAPALLELLRELWELLASVLQLPPINGR